MIKIRKHIGIHDINEIKAIQNLTSFEYIEEIEAVDCESGKQLYRVILSDTYVEGGNGYDCKRVFK